MILLINLDELSTRNLLPVLSSTKSMKSLSIHADKPHDKVITKLGVQSETTRAQLKSEVSKNYKNKSQIRYLLPKPPRQLNLLQSDSSNAEKLKINNNDANQPSSGIKFVSFLDKPKESSATKFSKNFSPWSKNPVAMTKIDLSNHMNIVEKTPKKQSSLKTETFEYGNQLLETAQRSVDDVGEIKFNKNAMKKLLSPFKTPKSDTSSLSKSLSEWTIQKPHEQKVTIPKLAVSNCKILCNSAVSKVIKTNEEEKNYKKIQSTPSIERKAKRGKSISENYKSIKIMNK